jgi:hypothetical protein
MLDKALAQSISNTVSSKIVTATKDIKIPEQSWQAIVQIIVEEIFTQITQNDYASHQMLRAFSFPQLKRHHQTLIR